MSILPTQWEGQNTWNILKRFIEPEEWHEPALLNNFEHYQAKGEYDEVRYKKDSTGRVSLKGLCKRALGTGTLDMFILPVGYRPLRRRVFFCICTAGAATQARVDIAATGNVIIIGNGEPLAFLSLDVVSFIP